MSVELDETTALLIRARGLLERGWCRGAQALDANGISIDPMSERAIEWRAYGALVAAGLGNGDKTDPAFRRSEDAIGGEYIARFNNRQESVEPVLAAFDRAIATGGQ